MRVCVAHIGLKDRNYPQTKTVWLRNAFGHPSCGQEADRETRVTGASGLGDIKDATALSKIWVRPGRPQHPTHIFFDKGMAAGKRGRGGGGKGGGGGRQALGS